MIRNLWFTDALKRKVLYIKIIILLIFGKDLLIHYLTLVFNTQSSILSHRLGASISSNLPIFCASPIVTKSFLRFLVFLSIHLLNFLFSFLIAHPVNFICIVTSCFSTCFLRIQFSAPSRRVDLVYIFTLCCGEIKNILLLVVVRLVHNWFPSQSRVHIHIDTVTGWV